MQSDCREDIEIKKESKHKKKTVQQIMFERFFNNDDRKILMSEYSLFNQVISIKNINIF